MGNFLAASLLPEFEELTLIPIEDFVKLRRRWETIQYDSGVFGTSVTLEMYVSLMSIFRGIKKDKLQKQFQLFDISQDQLIDAFEFLGGLLIICKGSFQKKLKHVFRFFDMDCNEMIARDEMVSLMHSCLLGFCKMTGTIPPTKPQLMEIAVTAFRQADTIRDQEITQFEYLTWARSQEEIVEIMTNYGTTDRDRVRKEFRRLKMKTNPYKDSGFGQDKKQANIAPEDLLTPEVLKKVQRYRAAFDQIVISSIQRARISDVEEQMFKYLSKNDTLSVLRDLAAQRHGFISFGDLMRFLFPRASRKDLQLMLRASEPLVIRKDEVLALVASFRSLLVAKGVPRDDLVDGKDDGTSHVLPMPDIIAHGQTLPELQELLVQFVKKEGPNSLALTRRVTARGMLETIYATGHTTKELQRVLNYAFPAAKLTAQQKKHIRDLFDQHEKNAAGEVNLDDLALHMKKTLGHEVPEDVIAALDVNGDNLISYEEWELFYSDLINIQI